MICYEPLRLAAPLVVAPLPPMAEETSMSPIIIIITGPAVVAIAILIVAVTALHMALTRRPALPRHHGLKEV